MFCMYWCVPIRYLTCVQVSKKKKKKIIEWESIILQSPDFWRKLPSDSDLTIVCEAIVWLCSGHRHASALVQDLACVVARLPRRDKRRGSLAGFLAGRV